MALIRQGKKQAACQGMMEFGRTIFEHADEACTVHADHEIEVGCIREAELAARDTRT